MDLTHSAWLKILEVFEKAEAEVSKSKLKDSRCTYRVTPEIEQDVEEVLENKSTDVKMTVSS